MTLVKVNNPVSKTFDGLFNDLFNGIPSSLAKNFREESFGFPPVNIVENTDDYQLELAAPGMEKTDFSLKVDGNLLTISASKKEEAKEETAKSIRREFSYKSFSRSFSVDEKINAANIAAKYENGILKITLPKKEEVKVAAKEIAVS